MKKNCKFEKQPVGAQEKAPKAKSALLQTYLTSLLCMVLCVTMFFGTTYAWFTSTVTNKQNEIYIGTLDMGFYKVNTTGGQTELLDLADDANKLFDRSIRWEPGYTSLETVQVVNKGDLAFNYVLNFTDGTLAEGSTQVVEAVAEYFEIWVYDHAQSEEAPAPKSFAEIMAEDSGWVLAGSLDQLLDGKTVLNGGIKDVRTAGQAATVAEGVAESVATANTYTIALHMKETADVSLVGQVISLNVKLVAYQMASENDDLGGKYDQVVATEEELKEKLENGGLVALAADIKLTEGVTVPAGVAASLDLNGHVISLTAEEPANTITNDGTLTIYDSAEGGEIAMIFEGTGDNSKAVNAIKNTGALIVNSGKITNTATKANNQIGYAIDNYNGARLTVNGGEITVTGSGYYDGIRLFCGSNDTVVTVNDGKISTIWAQNPSSGKATEVKGTVILNGGQVGTTYYENYTTVKVAEEVTATVAAYGAGSDNTTSVIEENYTVYSFVH